MDDATAPHAWRLETDLVLIESFRPGVDHTAFLDLFARTGRQTLGTIADGAPGVRFVGAIVVPGDEQVFYLVATRSMDDVRRLLEAAGLHAVRIVPAAWAAPLAGDGTLR
jgi:hypothetical protein